MKRTNALRHQALGIGRERLSFMQRRPAEAGGDGGPIIFALEHVLWAAVIKAEDLVVDIEAVHDELKAVHHAHAALGIELKVRIEVVVAEGARSAIPIGSDVLSVVRKAQTN